MGTTIDNNNSLDYPICDEFYREETSEQIFESCPDGFQLIPAGEFIMGTNENRNDDGIDDEGPAHKVYVDSFCLAETETSNQDYHKQIKGAKPSPRNFDQDLQPKVYVTWDQARNYCLSIGGDLPTEAQWEKAAKGKGSHDIYAISVDQQDEILLPYSPGISENNASEYFRYSQKGKPDGNTTFPVDSFLPNSYGIYNLTGNVAEWTRDSYNPHFYESANHYLNPQNPSNHLFKVYRGGSWRNKRLRDLEVTDRVFDLSDTREDYIGFRCVVDPIEMKSTGE